MNAPKLLLLGIGLPAGVSAAALLIACRPWQRRPVSHDRADRRARCAGALAIGLGYLAGHVAIAGWPGLNPAEAMQWLLHLAAVAMWLSIKESLYPGPPWYHWTARALLVGVAAWVLLHPLIAGNQSMALHEAWIWGITGASMLVWTTLDRLAERHDGPPVSAMLLLLATGTSGVLMISTSALLSQLAGALAAALGVCCVFAWRYRSTACSQSAASVALPLLAALWIIGYYYVDVPLLSVALLSLTPILAWLAEAIPVVQGGGWRAGAVRVASCLMPVAFATFSAYQSSPEGGFGY